MLVRAHFGIRSIFGMSWKLSARKAARSWRTSSRKFLPALRRSAAEISLLFGTRPVSWRDPELSTESKGRHI